MSRADKGRSLIALVAVLAAWLGGSGFGVASADGAEGPAIVKGRGERCVEPTEIIRSDHMRFLFHQRDETVLRGIRTKRHSLKECIGCHAGKDDGGAYLPINAEGQFCQSCHEYASVDIDCFDCHATRPRAAE